MSSEEENNHIQAIGCENRENRGNIFRAGSITWTEFNHTEIEIELLLQQVDNAFENRPKCSWEQVS